MVRASLGSNFSMSHPTEERLITELSSFLGGYVYVMVVLVPDLGSLQILGRASVWGNGRRQGVIKRGD